MEPNTDNYTTPTDDVLFPVLREIHSETPELGRAKILDRLMNRHGWRVSGTRLKKLQEKYDLQRPGQAPKESDLLPIEYPEDALEAQQRYKYESIRCFKIYSRGPYDFAVSPNADMAMKINLAHERLKEAGRPTLEPERAFIATTWPMKCLFEYYWAAAKVAGVSKEDVGRQLEAEYGVKPIPYLPPPPKPAEVRARRAAFKEESMKVKRELLKQPEGRKYIPVDAHGEPIWDQAKNGEFVVLVVKIDKGRGLEEFGRVK